MKLQMRLSSFSVLLALLVAPDAVQANVELILSHHIMKLTNYSAHLSSLAYVNTPQKEPEMSFIHYFNKEPDQALVVKAHGYCFGVFRGTTLTAEDWQENLELGTAQICDEAAEETTCCTTRVGFYKAYNAEYRSMVEEELISCAKTCQNKDECVVLTGHSQGGAVAAVAGIALASLNPYVITFGQPPTIIAPCERITSERWYRYVNTKDSESVVAGITYDPVPFTPGLGANFFGHMIILSEDSTGVAYVGLNAQDYFSPLNLNGFEAHSIESSTKYPGYCDRIKAIMEAYNASGTYPVRADGFLPGSHCTMNVECESNKCSRETELSWTRCVGVECHSDNDCESGRCDSGMCANKLASCQVCDEHSDCESGICSWRFRCATDQTGLMGNECLCSYNKDCLSGRCEGWKSTRICEPKMGLGATCDESSDCLSGKCSWSFRCIPQADPTPEIESGADEDNDVVDQDKVTETDEDETGDEGGVAGKKIIVICAALFCALGFGYGIHMIWWKRRHGYEEIPTRIIV